MRLKVRSIGNSKRVILPQSVLEQLGESELELTLIGNTAVLSRAGHEGALEARAALAYASVKAKRHGLFARLAKEGGQGGGDRGEG